MTYLIVQMLLCLLLAAAIGFAVGWLWRGRRVTQENEAMQADLQRQLLEREDQLRSVRGELEACSKELEDAAKASAPEEAPKAASHPQPVAVAEERQEEQTRRILELEAQLEEEQARIVQIQKETDHARQVSIDERSQLEADWKAKLDRCEKNLALATTSAASAQPKGPPKVVDDLKKIRGIGKVLERFLNDHGVYSYRQIVEWTPADIERLSADLPQFSGRIERDNWIGGARKQHLEKYGEEI